MREQQQMLISSPFFALKKHPAFFSWQLVRVSYSGTFFSRPFFVSGGGTTGSLPVYWFQFWCDLLYT
jgi:hypothetical protein